MDRDGLQFGVRPEHLKLSAAQPEQSAWTVDMVERLGVESFIHLHNAARDVLVARMEGDCNWVCDDQLAISVDPAQCYLFNAEGVRLCAKTAAGATEMCA